MLSQVLTGHFSRRESTLPDTCRTDITRPESYEIVPTDSKKSTRAISRPPGSLLSAVADFLCPRQVVERVVRPLISGMQREYFEALAEKRPWKARWIHTRDTARLFVRVSGLERVLAAAFEIFSRVS